MANVWAAGGDREHTFSWLERAYEEHNPDLIELRAELVFDSLRSDPQLRDLLVRVGWRNP
jgi:hypothetical protein